MSVCFPGCCSHPASHCRRGTAGVRFMSVVGVHRMQAVAGGACPVQQPGFHQKVCCTRPRRHVAVACSDHHPNFPSKTAYHASNTVTGCCAHIVLLLFCLLPSASIIGQPMTKLFVVCTMEKVISEKNGRMIL